MEAGTVSARADTTAATIADLARGAAARHDGRPALRHKVGDEWVDVSFAELGTTVAEVGLGLIALGIEPGDRVSILSNSRPEWTYANLAIMAAGAASVSIYQTNSPEECQYVLDHSGSRAIFVEDLEQLAKVRAVEAALPSLEFVIVMDAEGEIGDALPLAALRARGRERDPSELERRTGAVRPEDPCVYIYTSGTTGPPKGCVLSHSNYRAMVDMVERPAAIEGDELIYLFLPLAHAFALLIQFVSIDLGCTLAYWEKDPQKIVANLIELKPTYFPSVPRVFEKIYTLARAGSEDVEQLDRAIAVGVQVRELERAHEPVPEDLRAAFDEAELSLYQNVRNLFGGRIRQCVTGAAPIAREILEFFYACGVMIYEGYGMTETATSATCNLPEAFRFGSVGRPFEGVEVRIGGDGEVLLRGANIFRGYYRDEEASRAALSSDGWLHTGDLGHLDEDGFLYITGRKKDIIITAGGKNITPANIENSLKQSRWVSQAVVLGDRRPYLVALITLDPDELPGFAAAHDLEPAEVHRSAAMRAEIERLIVDVNERLGRIEQVKRFTILPQDLSQETGELTPTLKVKRGVVVDKFASEIEALYGG